MNTFVTQICNHLRLATFLAYIFLVGTIITSGYIFFAPSVWYWGDRHEPHTSPQRIVLSSGHRVVQTFNWEKQTIDAVMIMVDTKQSLPTAGSLILTLSNGVAERTSSVSFMDISKSGLVVFPISPPLQESGNREGQFALSLERPGQMVAIMYQIDGTKYPGGELVGRQGDLAFQLRYKVPAILASQFCQIIYAFLILASGIFLFATFKRPHKSTVFLAKKELLIALLLGLGTIPLFSFWLLRPDYWVGTNDFYKDVATLTASRDAVRSLSWPLWSHITCGGMPLLGNLEGNTFTLGTLFALVMQPEKAMMLMLAIEGGIGIAGMYLLARYVGIRRIGALLSAIIFSLSPTYAYRLAEGFTETGAFFAFTPWVFLGLLVGLKTKSRSFLLLSGLGLAAIFLRGGIHGLPYVLAGIVIVVVYEAIRSRSWFPIYALGAIGASSFLFSSIKLLAFLEQPNYLSTHLSTTVVILSQRGFWYRVLFELPNSNTWIPVLHGYGEQYGNFGVYIGILPIVLALVGLSLKKNHYRWVFLISAFIFATFSEGTIYEHSIRYIPFLNSLLRLPNRALRMFIFFAALLAGMGIERLFTMPFHIWVRRVIVYALVIFVSFNLISSTATIFSQNFNNRTSAIIKAPSQPTLGVAPNDKVGALFRGGYLLPQICGDQNIQPEFAATIDSSTALASVDSKLQSDEIILSNLHPKDDILVRERYLSSWVPKSGFAIAANVGSIQIVQSGSVQTQTLVFVNSLVNAEKMLFAILLISILCILWRFAETLQ